jgi:hypothetical protein
VPPAIAQLIAHDLACGGPHRAYASLACTARMYAFAAMNCRSMMRQLTLGCRITRHFKW